MTAFYHIKEVLLSLGSVPLKRLTSSLTMARVRPVGSRPMATQKKTTWIAGSRNTNNNILQKNEINIEVQCGKTIRKEIFYVKHSGDKKVQAL